MKTITISTGSISASASSTSSAIDLAELVGDNSRAIRPDGFFSLQYTITGDGTAKIEYLLSNDETTWVEPDAATDIATGLVKTSGAGGDGKGFVSWTQDVSKSMKIKVTETGTSSAVTAVLVLAVQ